MKLTTILHEIFEAKQVGPLYHYTGLNGILGILKTGGIKSGDADKPHPDTKHAWSSISFTRDKNFTRTFSGKQLNRAIGGTTGEDSYELFARLTIDGDKLSDKYKIEPFAAIGYVKGQGDFEAEERILMKDKFKLPLNPYVKSIDILFDYIDDYKRIMGSKRPFVRSEIFKVLRRAKKYNIDINWVDKNGNPVPVDKLKILFNILPNAPL